MFSMNFWKHSIWYVFDTSNSFTPRFGLQAANQTVFWEINLMTFPEVERGFCSNTKMIKKTCTLCPTYGLYLRLSPLWRRLLIRCSDLVESDSRPGKEKSDHYSLWSKRYIVLTLKLSDIMGQRRKRLDHVRTQKKFDLAESSTS